LPSSFCNGTICQHFFVICLLNHSVGKSCKSSRSFSSFSERIGRLTRKGSNCCGLESGILVVRSFRAIFLAKLKAQTPAVVSAWISGLLSVSSVTKRTLARLTELLKDFEQRSSNCSY
jgi:hypothetical protein